jgi:WXG100 protein secretion system (Wss), protein YukD
MMLASTLLVTVRGPLKTMDLELPGDVAVCELIPFLLEMCGSQKNDPKKGLQANGGLEIAGMGVPLLSDRTLIDANVSDGAVLVLQTKHVPSAPTERLAPRQFVSRSVQPDADTGGIGITWESLG